MKRFPILAVAAIILAACGTTNNSGVKDGKWFQKMSVGSHLVNYNSMVALTHFKGHTQGGFGGSNKNIGMGHDKYILIDLDNGGKKITAADAAKDLKPFVK